ncbi:MAG: Ig-like domain-containing protein [Anaerocolumna sp.]
MKIKRTKYLLISVFAIVLAVTGFWKFYQVFAANSDYWFFYESALTEGAEIELKSAGGSLIVKCEDGFDITDPDAIAWESSETNVLDVTQDATNPMIAELTRNGPGYSKVTAVIKQLDKTDGTIKTYTLTCKVKVDYKIDKSIAPFKQIFTTDLEDNYAMVLSDDIGSLISPVKLKYTNAASGYLSGGQMTWKSLDTSVVDVGLTTGDITVCGAGETQIEVSTNTTLEEEPITKSFNVIVEPKALEPNTTTPYKTRLDIEQTDYSSPLVFDTNAGDASKLYWEFYDENFKVIDTDGKISYSFDNSEFKINSAKAGVYYIRAYVKSDYKPSTIDDGTVGSVGFLQIKLTAKVNVDNLNDNIIMNVGDTYSVVDNSNIPDAGVFNYDSSAESVATVNKSDGVITAKGVGDTVITLTVIEPSSLTPKTFTINIKVIDGIALNYSSVNIYTAGTVQLQEYVTNRTQPVIWTTSNSSIATVKDGLVTGVAEGTVTITASQTINGVVKSATCIVNVQQSVNKITIDPDTVSLNINEKATLTAEIEPVGLNNVSLKWLSSNENVVKVDKAYDLSATIQGLASGTAVITAINEENVIVGYCQVTVKEKVTKITLSNSALTLSLSKKNYQLYGYITPDTATNKKINWTTTNSKVATVDSNGLVTLVSGGTASIIATSDDNPAVTAICNITVEIPAAALVLDETSKVLYVGDAYRLGYTITPTNAANKDITWSSSSTSVVSVSSTGLIKAVKVGQAIITAKTSDGTLAATCTITVKQQASGISLNVSDLELYAGQQYDLEVTVLPAGSNDYTLSFESSNTSVATVDDKGKITAVANGKATITVKTSNGKVAYCNVTVKAQAAGIQLNYKEKTIVIGEKFTIKATIVPSSASDDVNVNWSSSKTSVATVSSSGVVSAVKGGTTVITCKSDNGKFTEFCVVTVVERITSVKLNKSNIPVGLGKTYTLKATVKTNAATNPTIKWTSSNSRIATVDSKGKVSGKALGTVTITATAQDGSSEKDTCIIRVVRQATSISLSKTSVTTVEGRTFKLTATVKPSNASYKTLNWSSSDEKTAIVDSSGQVTALAEGTVYIKATAKDNSGKTAACFVIVQPRTPANSVTIINQNLTMVVGETTTIQKAINPTTSTDRFTWESDNKTVASVNSSTGKVTAKTPGIANITVMTESGKTATTKVTVVGLNTTNLVLEQYSTYRLSVIGITGGITWDISDNDIALVTNGLVSSRRIGTTTITATVNGRRLTCKLKVVKIK